MRRTKKAWTVAGVLVGLAAGACSGTSQLVGSDELAVGGTSGAGAAGGVPTTRTSVPAEFLQITPQEVTAGAACCIPYGLPEDTSGATTCQIATVHHSVDCDCSGAGLASPSEALVQTMRSKMQAIGQCGSLDGLVPCSEMCVCAVAPATGASLQQCQTQASPDASSSGWCYVSAEQGDAANSLLSVCGERQTHEIRLLGDAVPPSGVLALVTCENGNLPPTTTPAAIGEPCISTDESFPDFAGSGSNEINIDNHNAMCASQFCLQNHFQGRASCPYGQNAGDGTCFVPGTTVPVTVAVGPQLSQRQTAVASTCTCQCAGYGPGPYCTCPDDMECDHLIDKIGAPSLPPSEPDLSGSYCIPRGSSYDRDEIAVCTSPDCGAAHPY